MPSRTILFADDSATMRTIMEKTFAAEDFEVVTVPSGEAAITKAKEIGPSVILLDAGMVGVSGYDVCKTIREDAALGKTPVLLMSGVSNPYDDGRAKEVGATDHVKKPFDTTKLIEKVTELAGAAGAEAPAPAVEPPKPAQKPPAAGATLHAFPNPGAAAPKPPVPPSVPKAPAKPVPAPPAPKPAHKETMEFARPKPEPAAAEVKPIELDEPGTGDEGQIQVGTLAELAQMNEKGEHISHEMHDDAIELTEPAAKPSASEPVAPKPAPVTGGSVEESISAAAEVVAERVEGITPDQAEAIRKLTAEVIEQVVWEVVPDLAETMIRERIEELLAE